MSRSSPPPSEGPPGPDGPAPSPTNALGYASPRKSRFPSDGLSRSEVCRKHGISATYAYKLKDRALELLRQGIDHGAPDASSRERQLQQRVQELEQLAGDQALAIRALKKTKGWSRPWGRCGGNRV